MPAGPDLHPDRAGPDLHPDRAGPATRLTRRSLLATLPLLAVTAPGCRADPRPAAEPDPRDVAAVAAAIHRERVLLAAYDDAVTRHRELAGPLGAVRAHHAEHLQALEAASPSPPASPAATATGATGGGGAGLDELTQLEHATATAHRTGCLAATGTLATLLASLHAAETAHAELLGVLDGTANR